MDELTAKAYAKINLTLDVLRKREDNYHDLKMIMQSVSLHDLVTVKKSVNPGIKVSSNVGFLPTGNKNIAYVAAEAFFNETGIKNDGIQIHIQKKIPITAGLAGGSSDGAAVLRILNEMYSAHISIEDLCKIGEKAGSDVPFCVIGGTAIAEGKGEILTPITPAPNMHILICTPTYRSHTNVVFQNLNCKKIKYHPDIKSMINAIKKQDVYEISRGLYNVLEPEVIKAAPFLTFTRKKLEDGGACGVCMSGSGPSFFAICKNEAHAKSIASTIKYGCRDVNLCNFVTSEQVAAFD